jgi:hypothetical protein
MAAATVQHSIRSAEIQRKQVYKTVYAPSLSLDWCAPELSKTSDLIPLCAGLHYLLMSGHNA